MGNIPINPSSTIGAGIYATPTNAVKTNLCKQPQEGMQFIPMQFKFNQFTSWNVDLSSGAPNPPLSQVCTLYVDNTQCSHDINILFPDSGYIARIEQGGSRMIPVITGALLPKFFVILDSSGATNTTDVCNVFAINQFVPEFASNEVQKTLSYGYGQMFSLQPSFTQSGSFFQEIGTGTHTVIIIPNNQWYITGIYIDGQGTNATNFSGAVSLVDLGSNNTIIRSSFSAPGSPSSFAKTFVEMTGINYESAGGGQLQFNYNDTSGNASAYDINVAIFGGVLVT